MLKAQLVVVQGKPEGKAIPLVGPIFLIGRSEKCQLRPGSEEVSREHAELAINETGVTARDLGSRNGTLLNGKPMASTATPLKNGDLIQIGKLTFAISIQGGVASAPVRPVSLDEVAVEKIDQWLVSDPSKTVPDRPSGVYDGDTLTLNAYKEGGSGTHKAAAAPAAKPAAAAAPAAPKAAPPATAPTPVVAPPPPAPAVAAVAPPAPTARPAVAPPPVAVPVAPVVAPAPVTSPEPVFAVATSSSPSFLHAFLDNAEFESLAEGMGEENPAPVDAGDQLEEDADGDGGSAAAGPEDELMDESNPFYAAKKAQMLAAQQQPQDAAAKKAVYKESSDAANDILRRMTDRRRSV